jgi:WD40 repeat protein
MQELINDGVAFLRNYGHVIRLSALQTYYSALALTPKTTKLFQYFNKNIPQVPRIISSHATWPTASVRIMEGHTGWVLNVVFSPDGQKLASASYDNTVRLWDVETGQAIGSALEGHTSYVLNVVFSPDGQKLASASGDNTVRLWDVETGQAIGSALEGHTSSVRNVVFSADGQKLASASDDNTVQLWDVETGQPIGSALEGHTSQVQNVVFSPDGKKLASASYENTVRLWDVETGQPIGLALEGHTSQVRNVVFSPDGQKLASASYDKTVQLWDVETGQPIGSTLENHIFPIDSDIFFDGGITGSDPEALGSSVAVSSKLSGADMSFDHKGFLHCRTKRLLWLPVSLRGLITARPPVVAVGGHSGAITIIHYPVPTSSKI